MLLLICASNIIKTMDLVTSSWCFQQHVRHTSSNCKSSRPRKVQATTYIRSLGKVTKKQTHMQTFQRPWNHIFEGTGSILKTLILPVSFLRWGNRWSVQNQLIPKGTTFCKFPSCIERIPFQNSFCTNNQGTCTWTVRLARVSPTCQMNPSKNVQIPQRQKWHKGPFLVISTGCAKWKSFSVLFRSRSQIYLKYQVDPWETSGSMEIRSNLWFTS